MIVDMNSSLVVSPIFELLVAVWANSEKKWNAELVSTAEEEAEQNNNRGQNQDRGFPHPGQRLQDVEVEGPEGEAAGLGGDDEARGHGLHEGGDQPHLPGRVHHGRGVVILARVRPPIEQPRHQVPGRGQPALPLDVASSGHGASWRRPCSRA